MCFKKSLVLPMVLWATAIVFGISIFSGCGIVDEPERTVLNQVGPQQPECLTQVPSKVGSYFMGRIQSDHEIDNLWECTAQGMELFLKFTEGETPGRYTVKEMQDFLNRYFIEGEKISDGLAVEAMKLKASLLGGSTETLKKEEIEKFVQFLRILKIQAIRLKKIMPLSGERAGTLSSSEVEEGVQTMVEASQVFGEFIRKNQGQDLNLSDASNLLLALEKNYAGLQVKGSGIRLLREQLPVFAQVKKMLLNSSPGHIENEEWVRFLRAGALMHGIFLEYSHQKSNGFSGWLTASGAGRLVRVFSRALNLLQESASLLSQGTIQAEDVRKLADIFRKMKAQKNLDSIVMTKDVSDLFAKFFSLKQFVFGGKNLKWDLNTAKDVKAFIEGNYGAAWRLYETLVLKKDEIASMDAPRFQQILEQVKKDLAVLVERYALLRSKLRETETESEYAQLFKYLDNLYLNKNDCKNYHQIVGFIFSLKGLFLGPPSNAIETEDFPKFLKKLDSVLFAYLNYLNESEAGKEKERKLKNLWSVLDPLLTGLAEMAAERKNTGIQEQEILNVLETLPKDFREAFFKDNQEYLFVLDMVPKLMELKRGFVGGTAKNMTQSEATHLYSVVQVLKDGILSVYRFLPEELSEIKSWPEEKVLEFSAQIVSFGKNLAEIFNKGPTGAYTMADFRQLLSLLKRYTGREMHHMRKVTKSLKKNKVNKQLQRVLSFKDTLLTIEENLPLFEALKAVLVRPRSDVIGKDEWDELSSRMGQTLGVFLRVYHFKDRFESFGEGKDLARLSGILYDVVDILKKASRNRRNGQGSNEGILFSDLDRLVNEFYSSADRNKTEISLSLDTAKKYMRPLIRRFLGGVRWDETGQNANGLHPVAVDYLKETVDRWYEGQLILNRVFKILGSEDPNADVGYPKGKLIAEINAVEREVQASNDLNKARRGFLLEIINGIRSIIISIPPLFKANSNEVSILYDNYLEKLYSFNHLSRMNINHVIIQSFLKAYSSDRNRAMNLGGITAVELERFLQDTMQVLREMKFTNSTRTAESLSAQRFLETNMFTSMGNGDEYFGLFEGTEFLGYLFSAGPASRRLHEVVSGHCPKLEPDYSGKPMIPADCFRKVFFNPKIFYSIFTEHSPRMAYYYSTLQGQKLNQFIEDLEATSRMNGISDRPVGMGDIESFAMIPTYIESLFKRFDENRTGSLSVDEALKAYPVVCPKLRDVSGFLAECSYGESGSVEVVYGYLLKHGVPPTAEGEDFWAKLKQAMLWINWNVEWRIIKKTPGLFNLDFAVDRGRVQSIISAVTRMGGESPSSTSSSQGSPAKDEFWKGGKPPPNMGIIGQ